MKYVLRVLVLYLCTASQLIAQCDSNPSLQSGNISPTYLEIGQGGTLSFSFIENLIGQSDPHDDPIRLQIELYDISPVGGLSAIKGAFSQDFLWTYDDAKNTFEGVQNKSFGIMEGGVISLDFFIKDYKGCAHGNLGFKASLIPSGCMSASNITSDDMEAVYTCIEISGECDLSFNTIDVMPSNCSNKNGRIILEVNNGMPPYSYKWHEGTTENQLIDLGPGIYHVTVSDSEGCELIQEIEVTQECQNRRIASKIWNDINLNGMIDSDEEGISGVVVTLVNDKTSIKTTTDHFGDFYFEAINLDLFNIEIELPENVSDYVPQDVFVNSNNYISLSSSGGPSWLMEQVELTYDDLDSSFDIGFYKGNSVGSQVWKEAGVVNDYFDQMDQPLENIEVRLKEAENGRLRATTHTDNNGKYIFERIKKGNYFIEFLAPENLSFLNPISSMGNDVNSDTYVLSPDSGLAVSQVVVLASGDHAMNIDAGMKPKAVLAINNFNLEAERDVESNDTKLSWNIITDKIVQSFSVEKAYALDEDFENIGQVQYELLSNAYSYIDENTNTVGSHYYRLKINYIDEKSVYTQVVSIEVDVIEEVANMYFNIYPNPVTSKINLEFDGSGNDELLVSIMNPQGKELLAFSPTEIKAGKNHLQFDVMDLTDGGYLVKIKTKNDVKIDKFVKAE